MIYFFYGDEEFNISNEIKELKSKLDKNFIEMSYKEFDNPKFPDLISAVSSAPMMFGKMLIVIDCIKYFQSKKNDDSGFDDEQIEQLSEALENCNENLDIVFRAYATPDAKKKTSVDKRKKIFKILSKYNPKEFLQIPSYKTAELETWIKNQSKEKGLKINSDAVSVLLLQVGSNLRMLDSELEKLKVFCENRTATTKDIEEICVNNENLFAFIDYLEIYERNLELEKEIEERKAELRDANRRMFTLQHIWDMMNSSTPLENVLEAIVNSTQGELGYMHCVIIRKCDDNDGVYARILAQSKDPLIERLNNIIGSPSIQTRRLRYDDKSIFADSLRQKKIIQTCSLDLSLKAILPELSQETIAKILTNQPIKSVIVIPIFTREKEFGWFCVFSSREELASAETDFLSLFAKQIEMAITIADLFQAVKQEAVTDALTGLYNRRYFEETLEKEVARANRLRQPFSLIGIDLDFLKKINDTYGHAYGDIAIKTISNVLKSNARAVDIPARIGGEEFNIILPGIASEGAMIAAERIRKSIESIEIETIGHITGSLGVATYLEHTENAEELLELADQAMYASKRNGRNQVTLAKPITETSWQEIAINTFIDILSKNRVPLARQLSKDLCLKLESTTNEGEKKQEALYVVADMLTKLYNPMHEQGVVRNKVIMAVSLAKRFDVPKEEIDNLRVAILLYDIGNLMISPGLLQKATPLTPDEITKIKNHPIIAAREILKPISYVQDILPIIEHHHENWDGSGYPNKIAKDEIPITSQIILIIDEYFALIEARPYRSKMSSKDALEVIKSDSGKKWNDALVNEFISLVEHDIV